MKIVTYLPWHATLHRFYRPGIFFDLEKNRQRENWFFNKGGNKMEAADLSPPSTDITKSEKKYQNYFWRWYEKLTSFCEKQLIPGWADKSDQNPDKLPLY